MIGLKHLFQPIRIGSMEVENRLMVSAMGVGFGTDEHGVPTDQLIAFLTERARSRPGMMVTGASIVHPTGRISDVRPMRMIHLWDDRVLPGLERMVKAVHHYEVRFGCQLNHGGLTMLPGPVFLPSAISRLTDLGLDIREPTRDDIHELVEAFGSAAARCVRAGFDFLEIHAGHGYLIHTFLDPYFNRRTDEYGGTLENRARFLLEVIGEVRRRAGDYIPIGVKLSGDDGFKDGLWGIDDLCALAPILEAEGVAYLNITCGSSNYGVRAAAAMIAPMYVAQGDRVHFAEQVKMRVSIPVATVGRVKDPVMADDIIRSGRADLVAMGRAYLADPEFVSKARAGDIASIRPCLADCLGCIDNIRRYAETSCTVNPRVGREHLIEEIEGEKRADPKRVLVAGAGPAGLEAARRAAFAGHKVILCDSRPWIGGQLNMAANMPERQEIGDILPWYERQLNKYGVEVWLNTEVNDGLINEIALDFLVVATGSLPLVPQGFIKGLENIEGIIPMMPDELIEENRLTGDTVLIVGGDQIGLQIAHWLAVAGKKVFMVERGRHLGEKMAEADRTYLLDRISETGAVTIHQNVERMEILPADDVWIVREGLKENLPGVETIVFASDRRPNRFLAEISERMGIETHLAGDARGVMEEGMGTLMAAIASGYDAGRQI
ncbi:MAG: FAD-dependent oxidoreductase [Dehalococcoidia bacterium]